MKDDLDALLGTPLSDGSTPVPCEFCEGKGVFPETASSGDDINTERCPVCDGRGVNIISKDAELTYRCRYCDGSGRAWSQDGHFVGNACSVCGGVGYISLGAASAATHVNSVWDLIHPRVRDVARKKFQDGHYADSVESALKEINALVTGRVREATGKELDGASAMQCALSVKDPIMRMGDLTTESGRNMQQGYLQIFAGAMTGIRNPKAHANLSIDATRALHHLFLASLLMYKIDEAAQYTASRQSPVKPIAPRSRPR
jgi:uncharacterized protein (TIGR02391 family)